MSMIYDNWERLLDAVLDREHYRQLCRDNSSVYSIGTSSDSRFSSPLNDVASLHFPSPAPSIDARSSPSQSVFQQGQTSSANTPPLTKAVFKVDVKDDRDKRSVMKAASSFSAKIKSNDQNSEAFKIGGPTKNANRKTMGSEPGPSHVDDRRSIGSYAVPKFGEWDENDPTSGEDYAFIFDKIREERRIEAAKFSSVQLQTSKKKGSKKESFKKKMRDLFTYVRRS